MPYIKYQSRLALNNDRRPPANAGELNYKITKLLLAYLGEHPNYERFNAVVGVLECAKLELYRRMVVPYEDAKREEIGDVYPPEKKSDDAS